MKRIKLTQGKYSLVDNEDFDRINSFRWHYHQYRDTGYAARGKSIDRKERVIWLHYEVLNLKYPYKYKYQIDHKNGNKLDNQKRNLRFCTKEQNASNCRRYKNNKSGYKGVYWFKYNRKWSCQIQKNKIRFFLGYFDNEIDAAKVYNQAAKKYFGEFARLNQI